MEEKEDEEEQEEEEEAKKEEKNFNVHRSQDKVGCFGEVERVVTGWEKKGSFWEPSNVLFIDLTAGYTCLSL